MEGLQNYVYKTHWDYAKECLVVINIQGQQD